MAKKDKSQGKLRVFLFELEGSDDTLQESIRSITDAVKNAFEAPQTRVIVHERKLLGNGEEIVEEFDEIIEEMAEEVSNESPKSKPKRAKATRNYRSPVVLEDVDLKMGDVSFEEFVELKKPQAQKDKYMVVAAWFNLYGGLEEITQDHVYTCFRLMKWGVPKDMAQPLRDLKSRDGYFGKGAGKGAYRVEMTTA